MTDERPLPIFVRDLLSSLPRRGDGLNNGLFRVARVLHAFRSEPEIIELLRAATAGEPIKAGEIERAVTRSRSCAWTPGAQHGGPSACRWPKINAEQREAILTAGRGLVDLWEGSPVRFVDNESHTEEVIDVLFPGNPLLCVGLSSYDFATHHREELRGRLETMALIVPSPMTATTGLTQDGKESQHSLANTGSRRFLVIEQDGGTVDEQAAILLHLAQWAPLVLAVHSGGKSIHGWFMAAGQPEDRLRRFMAAAVSLGADPATWTRSQFVRMPGGTRDGGIRQAIYFFNPANIR